MTCIFKLCKMNPMKYRVFAPCDLFKLRHYTRLSKPIFKRATSLGVIFSLIYVIVGVIIVTIMALDLFKNNTIDRKSIVPDHTMDASIPRKIIGTYTIVLLLHNFNDKICEPSIIKSVGIAPHLNTTSTLFTNFTCKIVTTCQNCYLDGSQQMVDFTWNTDFASASVIELYTFLPHYFAPDQPFVVYEALMADSIFKGQTDATQITLSLTRAYHTILQNDNFFNSFLARRTGGNTKAGYVAAKYPSRLGSMLQANNFFSQTGLRITITFLSDANVFRVEQESLFSTLEWLAKLFSLVSAAYSFVGLAMTCTERYASLIKRHVVAKNEQGSAEQQEWELTSITGKQEQQSLQQT